MQSLWMVAAGLCFAVMGVFVKVGAAYFTTAELVFYRSLVSMVAMAALLMHQGVPLRSPRFGMHVHRGVAGFVSLFMFFYAMAALPLATAVTLNYTSPIFLTLLTLWLLRERVKLPLVLTIALGFAGAVLLLQPTFSSDQLWGGIIGLASGAMSAVAYYNVRQLVQVSEPEPRVVFYFGMFCCLGALTWMIPQGWHVPTIESLPLIAGLGVMGTLGQLFMTRAYGQGKTLVAAALSYSTIIFSSILATIVWHDALPWTSWLAMALIVVAGMLALQFSPGREAATPQVEND